MSRYSELDGRWEGLGPYYAMFPLSFARKVVLHYSDTGDRVLDPFCGRGSSLFAAGVSGRSALGVEINPVGWIYSSVKLHAAKEHSVLRRLEELTQFAKCIDIPQLPLFFDKCYSKPVLRFLIACRSELNWKRSNVDRTLIAIILVYLHGKLGQSLSNQMRQGKSMAPDYSVRWWDERGLIPPKVDVFNFLKKRIEWRYAKGSPKFEGCTAYLGDSLKVLNRATSEVAKGVSLLFTSPPYLGVTNYHYDQWLRLWLLGFDHQPKPQKGPWAGRFAGLDSYADLLYGVFASSAELMKRDARVYIRTDARDETLTITHDALKEAFPRHRIRLLNRPFERATQTALFGDKALKPGEVDLII